jgi:hypothetical protein
MGFVVEQPVPLLQQSIREPRPNSAIYNAEYGSGKQRRRPVPTHPGNSTMCRNIKTLFNFDPPATEDEIHAASLQFVRKLSGFNAPSKANQAAFDRAIDEVASAARVLIESLVTTADPRDREIEAARAKARAAVRFGVAG